MCKKSSLSKSWNIRSQRNYYHKMHIPWNIRRSRKSITQWCQLYLLTSFSLAKLIIFQPTFKIFFFSSRGFSWDVSETQIPSCVSGLLKTQNHQRKLHWLREFQAILVCGGKKALRVKLRRKWGIYPCCLLWLNRAEDVEEEVEDENDPFSLWLWWESVLPTLTIYVFTYSVLRNRNRAFIHLGRFLKN